LARRAAAGPFLDVGDTGATELSCCEERDEERSREEEGRCWPGVEEPEAEAVTGAEESRSAKEENETSSYELGAEQTHPCHRLRRPFP